MPMNRTSRDRIRKAAKEFWNGLTPEEKWELGDALVRGTVEDKDWIETPPAPQGFWAEVDKLRMKWEEE
jgi:hypothetical protein